MEEDKFYTKSQKEDIQKKIKDPIYSMTPMNETTGLVLLDILGEQQNTLQDIEHTLQRIESILWKSQNQ